MDAHGSAEVYKAHTQEFAEIRRDLGSLRQDVGGLQERVAAVETTVGRIDADFSDHPGTKGLKSLFLEFMARHDERQRQTDEERLRLQRENDKARLDMQKRRDRRSMWLRYIITTLIALLTMASAWYAIVRTIEDSHKGVLTLPHMSVDRQNAHNDRHEYLTHKW